MTFVAAIWCKQNWRKQACKCSIWSLWRRPFTIPQPMPCLDFSSTFHKPLAQIAAAMNVLYAWLCAHAFHVRPDVPVKRSCHPMHDVHWCARVSPSIHFDWSTWYFPHGCLQQEVRSISHRPSCNYTKSKAAEPMGGWPTFCHDITKRYKSLFCPLQLLTTTTTTNTTKKCFVHYYNYTNYCTN